MDDTPPRKVWFPAKTYGWGWGPPVCWQGWVVMAAYVALLAGGAFAILRPNPANAPWFVLYSFGLSGLLVLVCWLKGEKPAWRWGGKRR